VRRWLAIAGAVVLGFALVLIKHEAIAKSLVAAIAGAATGTTVSIGGAQIDLQHADLANVDVQSRAREPIARIAQIDVGYNLRDLLPGSSRRFGLESLDVESPDITVIRHADGSYNIPIPHQQAGAPNATPFRFTGVLRNGRITIVDESPHAFARELTIEGVRAALDVNSSARSTYSAALTYIEGGRFYPISGSADLNAPAGYARQTWILPPMPIARLVDFGLNSASMHLTAGRITGAHIRIFGLPDATGSLHTEFAATTQLRGVTIAATNLTQPVRGLHGGVDVYGNGIIFDGVSGTLAGVPVAAVGGAYDLANPSFRLALRTSGDTARLRLAATQSARLPISGNVDIGLRAEGPAANPLVLISVNAPAIRYDTFALQQSGGLFALRGNEVDAFGMRTSYRDVQFEGRGRISLQQRPNAIELLALGNAPVGSLPYEQAVLPGMPLHATVLATANDPTKIQTQGVLHGRSAAQTLAGEFAVTSQGVGTLGPLEIDGSRGSLYAQGALDHPRGSEKAVVVARDFRIDAPNAARLNGSAVLLGNGGHAVARVQGRGMQGAIATLSAGTLAIAAARLPVLGGELSAGALVRGTMTAPKINATIVASGMHYGQFPVSGVTSLGYGHSVLGIKDTTVGMGPAFVSVDGTVGGLAMGKPLVPRLDVNAHARAVDAQQLAKLVQPSRASLIQGSIDSDVRVTGTQASPYVRGSIDVPEGSLNGLAFRGLHGYLDGTPADIALRNGSVTVGSSAIAFSAGGGTSGAFRGELHAPRVNLADFNDFFDTGDTLAGTGSINATASYSGARLATSGTASFSDARFRRFDVGTTYAHWTTAGRTIAATVDAGGPYGSLRASGTFAIPNHAISMTAAVRNADLTQWLPMLGYNVPVTGHLNARGTVAGRFPDLDSTLSADVEGGTAGPLTVQRATVALHTIGGRGRIDSALVQVPDMVATASGGFGLGASDPLSLSAHITSPDIGAFAQQAVHSKLDVGGALDTTINVDGTRSYPQISDAFAIDSLRYGKLTIPHVGAQIVLDKHDVVLKNGLVNFTKGRILLAAAVPLQMAPFDPPREAPFTASMTADDVELANFADALPQGAHVSGRLDGSLSASGAIDNPRFGGKLTLDNVTYSGPQFPTPIDAGAQLAFSGNRVTLQNASATVGGGTIDASGGAYVPSMRDFSAAAFTFTAAAHNALFNVPKYYNGRIDGALQVARRAGSPIAVSGSMAFSQARVPLDAFLGAGGSSPSSPALPPIAFDSLHIVAGNNLRVQSPNVDVGAAGALTINGTLASPKLSGSFNSMGGTLSFYRNFNIERARVSFDPKSGIIPYVNANASTFITNPDTDIHIHVTGPATGLNLALSSQPEYDRSQILGLLVGAQQFGAVQGVQSSGTGSASASGAVQSLATGQLNQVFSRNLFEPLSTALGSTLGLTNVQLTAGLNAGFGARAVKAFGRDLDAIFAQSFGEPIRESFTLEARPSSGTAISLTTYTQQLTNVFGAQQPFGTTASQINGQPPILSIEPMSGTNGLDLLFERKFWNL